MIHISTNDTIAAIATAPGMGGIAVIRVSGKDAVAIVSTIWKGKDLTSLTSHTAHLGHIVSDTGDIIDQVVVTLYRAPRSFTGEDVVEIAAHGSTWIQNEIINELVRHGCRPARGGEFSQRAFLNGKVDLAEAEGIADLIASSSRAAHRIAMSQMKGEFSSKLSTLRGQLLNFVSLLELELDFSEEEVEFADRSQLISLATEIKTIVDNLADSFSIGASIKEGIPIAIAGVTNVGKSTLLNRLLRDDKAIVSDVHGTTRDFVEDTMQINGILFRFIDTAGLRDTDDIVENIGIQRAEKKIKDASLILWVIDPTSDIAPQLERLNAADSQLSEHQQLIVIVNKADVDTLDHSLLARHDVIHLSAKTGQGITDLESKLTDIFRTQTDRHDIIVTNARHYQALLSASEALSRALDALNINLPGDLVSQDIRQAMYHLGEITGEISTDDLLGNIFANFCIGK
ncbi:MAG: tRNA uridine-5-carboxymethylaminomethyl(34) synthesis GTPase MnmE [Muribaculaceae bacterium]|nr:tRNA uridine-5-carboxymethylaminomethyl(34) synthesis GTPase MnmE [Muribaculaceae bacterium]